MKRSIYLIYRWLALNPSLCMYSAKKISDIPLIDDHATTNDEFNRAVKLVRRYVII